jgi:hypothetical protein
MLTSYWDPQVNLDKWTDEQWQAAFEAEGPFSWRDWYGAGYPALKKEMKEQGAEFCTYTVNSGKCIRCTDRVAITDLSIEFRHKDRESWTWVTDRDIHLTRFYDPCDCD